MEAGAVRPGYELWRPNRQKAEAKSAKALVVFLLLVSAALCAVITIGGWERLEGGNPEQGPALVEEDLLPLPTGTLHHDPVEGRRQHRRAH